MKLITMLGSAQEQKIVIGTQMISVVEENGKTRPSFDGKTEKVTDRVIDRVTDKERRKR